MTAEPIVATRWEEAHQRFQTPEEEVAKFRRRFRALGAEGWDRTLSVAEICSGRGNGLRAWHELGFTDVVGVDLSIALAGSYRGPGRVILGDARCVPLRSDSRDIVVVQGGLHHLESVADMAFALAEMARIARPGGRIIVIEPWLTPFLRFVHVLTQLAIVRRLSAKIDAIAVMNEEEWVTYDAWLSQPGPVLELIERYVSPALLTRKWGKLMIVGRPVKPTRL